VLINVGNLRVIIFILLYELIYSKQNLLYRPLNVNNLAF